MTIKKTLIACALALGAVLPTTSALAQWSVFDPTNWLQNMTSASAAVRNEINTANALIHQAKSAIALAKSTSSIKNLAQLAGVEEAAKLYSSLRDIDTRVIGTLTRNQALAQNLNAQYGASNTSWDQFVSAKNSIAADERKASLDHYEAVNASLAETAQRRQQIVSQLSGVQGQTEALQTLGAALDVIIGQNQQIIMSMKTSSVVTDNRALDQQQDQSKGREMMHTYQQRLREAAAKY
jgi:hypothetical protein